MAQKALRPRVVCRTCGEASEVRAVADLSVYPSPSEAGGFVVDEVEVTFWGLCPACQTGGPSPEEA
jgi:Fur family ferric uptake transcriptional regulator